MKKFFKKTSQKILNSGNHSFKILKWLILYQNHEAYRRESSTYDGITSDMIESCNRILDSNDSVLSSSKYLDLIYGDIMKKISEGIKKNTASGYDILLYVYIILTEAHSIPTDEKVINGNILNRIIWNATKKWRFISVPQGITYDKCKEVIQKFANDRYIDFKDKYPYDLYNMLIQKFIRNSYTELTQKISYDDYEKPADGIFHNAYEKEVQNTADDTYDLFVQEFSDDRYEEFIKNIAKDEYKEFIGTIVDDKTEAFAEYMIYVLYMWLADHGVLVKYNSIIKSASADQETLLVPDTHTYADIDHYDDAVELWDKYKKSPSRYNYYYHKRSEEKNRNLANLKNHFSGILSGMKKSACTFFPSFITLIINDLDPQKHNKSYAHDICDFPYDQYMPDLGYTTNATKSLDRKNISIFLKLIIAYANHNYGKREQHDIEIWFEKKKKNWKDINLIKLPKTISIP